MTNINEHAAIYGLDGTPWAASAGFQLGQYAYKITQEDGSEKEVQVNEFVAAHEASKGNRKGTEAGIRMNN